MQELDVHPNIRTNRITARIVVWVFGFFLIGIAVYVGSVGISLRGSGDPLVGGSIIIGLLGLASIIFYEAVLPSFVKEYYEAGKEEGLTKGHRRGRRGNLRIAAVSVQKWLVEEFGTSLLHLNSCATFRLELPETESANGEKETQDFWNILNQMIIRSSDPGLDGKSITYLLSKSTVPGLPRSRPVIEVFIDKFRAAYLQKNNIEKITVQGIAPKGEFEIHFNWDEE